MNYFANEKGQIFNESGKEMRQRTHKKGYKTFSMYDGEGNKTEYYSHRFIWEYFNGDIPEGFQIDHINNIKDDNRLDNLRVVSPKFNSQRRESNKLSINACRAIRLMYAFNQHHTHKSIAEQYDCSPVTICRCINGETWN